MSKKQGPATQAQRHAAALQRAGQQPPQYPTSAADYFSTARGAAATRANTHLLPQVRAPEELARRLADYGNRKGLSYSESIRSLLHVGLETEGIP